MLLFLLLALCGPNDMEYLKKSENGAFGKYMYVAWSFIIHVWYHFKSLAFFYVISQIS